MSKTCTNEIKDRLHEKINLWFELFNKSTIKPLK